MSNFTHGAWSNNSYDCWATNDGYLSDRLIDADGGLEGALASSRENDIPEWEISPLQGKFLYLLAKMKGAKRILELGTLGGYSTIWLAKAVPDGGVVVSVEHNEHYANVARRNIENAGLSDRVNIMRTDCKAAMEQLIAEKATPFDMIFIDSDKPNYPVYLELALQLSAPGTVIFADNVIRNGELCNADTEDDYVKGVQAYVGDMGKLKQLESTALQTVGVKGYDGFSLSIVT